MPVSPFPTLQTLSATAVVKQTRPDISHCNIYICNTLLELCVKYNQLRMFRTLLESWPHVDSRLNLKAATLHYLQSLAILEHQGVVSKVLKNVFVNAPYAGKVESFLSIQWFASCKNWKVLLLLIFKEVIVNNM